MSSCDNYHIFTFKLFMIFIVNNIMKNNRNYIIVVKKD